MQEEQDPTGAKAFIVAFTGDDRFVSDYLVAEVLQRQPEVMRQFLRQRAILDRLTASLCDTVLGSENSQAMLERLDEGSVFLILLDRCPQWYRYHRLFAEALRTALTRSEQMQLQQRAARWFEAHGFMGQAIRHILACASTAGDWDDVQGRRGSVSGVGAPTVGLSPDRDRRTRVRRQQSRGVEPAVGATSLSIVSLFVSKRVQEGVLSWLLAVPLSYPSARLFSNLIDKIVLQMSLVERKYR